MPSSSLFLRSSTTLATILSLFSAVTLAADEYSYSKKDAFQGQDFVTKFDYFTDLDPTHGFVTYVDSRTAQSSGLISYTDKSFYMGVDSQNVYNHESDYKNQKGLGRPSVRIESQQTWNKGLFVADIAHMPDSTCGNWPAWWTLSKTASWPNGGEIDIVEGVGGRFTNLAALHTGQKSKITGDSSLMTGTLEGTDCQFYSATGSNAAGCGVRDTRTSTYGDGFNAGDGRVVAMEWTDDTISVWSFARGEVPADIASEQPNPATWTKPAQVFSGPDVNIPINFKDHKMIVDTTFCGNFGDAVWSGEGCASKTGYASCAAFVANNPAAFSRSYWQFNSIKVYQKEKKVATTTVSSTTTSKSSTMSSSSTTQVSTTTSSSSKTMSSSTSTSASTSSSPSLLTSSSASTTKSSSTTLSTSTTSSKISTSSSMSSTSTKSTATSSASTASSTATSSFGFFGNGTTTRHGTTSTTLSTVSQTNTNFGSSSTSSGTITSSSTQSTTTTKAASDQITGKPNGGIGFPNGGGVTGWSEWSTRSPEPAPTFITTTITKTYVLPCETGLETRTTTITTSFAGGKPLTYTPEIPSSTYVTTCPAEWGFGGPVTVTVPITTTITIITGKPTGTGSGSDGSRPAGSSGSGSQSSSASASVPASASARPSLAAGSAAASSTWAVWSTVATPAGSTASGVAKATGTGAADVDWAAWDGSGNSTKSIKTYTGAASRLSVSFLGLVIASIIGLFFW